MNVARSIGILMGLNVLGALIALANSVVVALLFGTTRVLEVFFAAASLQAIVARLTQTGQLGEIFLPIYHRIRERQGREAAREAFAVLLNWTLLLVAVLIAVLWLAAPVLLRMLVPGFAEDDRAGAATMFRWILPLLAIQVALALSQTLANAERHFGRAEALAVGSRLATLASLLLLAAPLGVRAMVAALWAGHLFQLAGYAGMLWRMGYRHHPRLRQEGFSAWSVFRQLVMTLGYVGATQAYSFALDAGLSLLPRGTYAVFKYVQQLSAKTNAVLLRPVSVVFFTHFSEALAKGLGRVRELAQSALARCLGISTIVIAGVVVAGRPLLAGLWGSDQFAPEHLTTAANLLSVFYVLLVPTALATIGRKTTMSLGLVGWQYGLTSLVQLASAAAAWWGIGAWSVGGAMGAMAFNALALAAVPMAILAVRRREAAVFYAGGNLVRWLTAGGAGLAAGVALRYTMPVWTTTPGHGSRWTLLAGAGLLGTATAAVCLTVAWLLGVHEVREVFRRLRGTRPSPAGAEGPDLPGPNPT